MLTACQSPQYLNEYALAPQKLLTPDMVSPYAIKTKSSTVPPKFTIHKQLDKVACQYYWQAKGDKDKYYYLSLEINPHDPKQRYIWHLDTQKAHITEVLGNKAYWEYGQEFDALNLVVVYGSYHLILSLSYIRTTPEQAKEVAIDLARQILRKCKKR